ncbi:MAG TPA: molybdopterin-dependent oxidoreductase [Syntrophomonas sp.]|nr:molybdopterin-dependent oxidoreductase [Syntrophomonas sp.]
MPKTVKDILPSNINKDVYHEEWQWQEGDLTVTRSVQYTGPGCHNGCSVLFYTKDGKLVDIEGDPNSSYNSGRLCMRCLNMMEAVDNPDRLKWPLKRVGERGENKWKRITWDEAYDIIEAQVRTIWEEDGPEAIVSMEGTGRNIVWQVPYLSYSAFKSPNFGFGFLSGDACYLPRIAGSAFVMGDMILADCSQFHEQRYNDPSWKIPEYILIWGNNPIVSNGDGFFGHWIVDCMKLGTKLMVVDPRLTWLASRAEHWLQLRPGTDTALVLSMLNVIINEDLYDHEWVEKWGYGFDDLKERVQQYPPEKVAEITWVPADQIIAAARAFAAAKPAALQWGLAVDTAVSGVATAHALLSMAAMCGNLDVPGGTMIARSAYHSEATYMFGRWNLPEGIEEKQIGRTEPAASPVHAAGGSQEFQSDAMLRAIETGIPYPIKMLWMQTTNPIANMAAEAPRVYDAMKKVPFNVVVDLFMTPTAVAAADLVLPAAMSCERVGARTWWWPMRAITKVSQYEEAKSDEQIILDIGKRLRPECFPWDNEEDFISFVINPYRQAGDQAIRFQANAVETQTMTWPKEADFDYEELKKAVIKWPDDWSYNKYEKGLLRGDGQPGFNTPSGKYEFSSLLFEMWDIDPLPAHEEPPESPVSTPELFKEYPLVLTSGARSWEFFHSEHRQQETMREFHPDPLVEINPETAAALGIQDGDWVWIENMRGKCRQKVRLSPALHPKVVSAEHGWWFPEKAAAEPSLFGVFDSNINNLTQQEANGPTGFGAPYKNQICKIYKDDGAPQVMPSEIVTRMGGFAHGK